MTQSLLAIVNEYREMGIPVTDAEAEQVCQYCYRKMEIAGIENPERYLPLLYRDELKNHLIRGYVTAASLLLKQIAEVL